MATRALKTIAEPMEVEETHIQIVDLPIEVLVRIFHFLPARDLHRIGQACTWFAEAAAHPLLLKHVRHKITSTSLPIYLSSKTRVRNVVFSELNFDTNRAVKRLWKRIVPEIVDLTLDECLLRGATLYRMLRDAKKLQALTISRLDKAIFYDWKAKDFKRLKTNIHKLDWNLGNCYITDDFPVAVLSAMPEITEISLGANEWYPYARNLPAKLTEFLQGRLPFLKSLSIFKLYQEDLDMFGGTAPLPNMRVLVLESMMTRPNNFLSRLVNLKSLALGSVRFDNQTLASVSGLNELENLELSGYNLNNETLQTISKMKSLKKLTIQKTNITDTGYLYLFNLNLAQMVELKLVGSNLLGLTSMMLIEKAMNLRVLVINSLDFTTVMFEVLLQTLIHLKELDIGVSSEREPLQLCKVQTNRLQKLTLNRFPNMTNTGLRSFARFNLVDLKLVFCTSVTPEGLKEFILMCPSLERFEFLKMYDIAVKESIYAFAKANLKCFKKV